jgi:hypothetical protein
LSYIGKIPATAPLTSSDVADGIITNAKLAQDIISADTALGATPADTDEFLVSDAGVLKRMDYSHIKGGGKILQMQQMYDDGAEESTTSTSYVDSSIADSITCSATSSKVLGLVTLNGHRSTVTNTNIIVNVERDIGGSTTLMTTETLGLAHTYNIHATVGHFTFLDSPSSTSAITYTVQYKVDNSNTGHIHRDDARSSMILFEIGA